MNYLSYLISALDDVRYVIYLPKVPIYSHCYDNYTLEIQLLR